MSLSVLYRVPLLFALVLPVVSVVAAPGPNVDITMGKIVLLIKSERWSEALPYFEQLESSAEVLPESFYFYQIEALYKSKDVRRAQSKVDAYLARFKKTAKYYPRVVEIGSIVGIEVDQIDKEARALAAKKNADEADYERRMKEYNQAMVVYREDYQKREVEVERCVQVVDAEYEQCYAKSERSGLFGTDYTRTENQRRFCYERNNSKNCDRNISEVTAPERPERK